MIVTYFGTTTLLFDDGTDQILFDCHFTRPSLAKYIASAPAVSNTAMVDQMLSLHSVDRLKAIFISHTHHDHVLDAPYTAKKTGALIYGSKSAMNVALGGGVSRGQLIEFKPFETYEAGAFRVRILPSLHSKPTILNNDLGQIIEQPLMPGAGLREYKEGGSYDFYIEHGSQKFLIRPSFNYIEGQLDGIKADVLFLGVAGLAKADEATERKFFQETAEKVSPKLIIPVHWDNFFSPLDQPAKGMPHLIEETETVFFRLMKYCESHDIRMAVQIPRTSIDI